MQKENYTLKEIELPLSLDKEYILVDVDGWLEEHNSNKDMMESIGTVITKPFSISTINGDFGYVQRTVGAWMFPVLGVDEHKFFREVVRIVQIDPAMLFAGTIDASDIAAATVDRADVLRNLSGNSVKRRVEACGDTLQKLNEYMNGSPEIPKNIDRLVKERARFNAGHIRINFAQNFLFAVENLLDKRSYRSC